MSYPPPPGIRSSSSTPLAHSSLPPRPPPAASTAAGYGSDSLPTAPGAQGSSGVRNPGRSLGLPGSLGLRLQPRSIVSHNNHVRSHSPTVSAAPAPPSAFAASHNDRARIIGQAQLPSQPGSNFQEPYANLMPPQLQNPFPLAGQGSSNPFTGPAQDNLDPEMEAQIAQWQSAYASKDGHSTGVPRPFNNKWAEHAISSAGPPSNALGSRLDGHGNPTSVSANTDTGIAEVVTAADGKQKTVVRQGGGQTWQDPSLLEWDPAHFRLFVGNLAGEVTDDSLLKAFAKYPSVQKARVVRDKRTTKSKGYGFVSFADGDEYFQAARDMQGKYIGSHPVLLRKSTTEIRPTISKEHKRGGKRGKGASEATNYGAGSAHGVFKKQSKLKNGLKILG